jgi:hypothetical protein
MSYNDDELVGGGIGVDDEETEGDAFEVEDSPVGEDFSDDEDEEEKAPEGFLSDMEE